MPVIIYKRQRQILDFLVQFIQIHGHAPTLQEIADAIGVTSLATVHEHLRSLSEKKLIRRYDGAVRGIDIIDQKIPQTNAGVEVPILGYIAAGQPIEPYTDPNANMHIAPSFISGKKRSFILQVKGDSMIDEGILDGDYVIVEQQEEANNGDIVVALLQGGVATLKRYFKEKDRVRLEPANAKMKPIYAKDVRVQGKIVGVIRKYANPTPIA